MSLMLHRAGLLRPSLAAPVPSVPAAFEAGDWSIAPGDEEAEVTISSLPANGGASITGIEYRLDGGSWISSGGTSSFTITGLTNDQEYDVELRAINSVGAGAASDAKQVTPEASGAWSPLDLAPELFFQISDLSTLKQERTGGSATTPAGVGDPVGSIQNLGTAGGWATAPSDSARMILRQTGGGKYYLEADSNDSYTVSFTNSAGARTSIIGVLASNDWEMSTDNNSPNNTDGQNFATDFYLGGGSSRLYQVTSGSYSATSPGAVISTRSGPGATPAVWRNSGSALTISDLTGRAWGATISRLFGGGGSPKRYYGYFSKYADMASGDRNAVETWMADQMGISI